MRERLRTYLENSPGVRVIQRAAESEFYPALICLIVFIAYCSDHELLFASILVAFASVKLILFRDLKSIPQQRVVLVQILRFEVAGGIMFCGVHDNVPEITESDGWGRGTGTRLP